MTKLTVDESMSWNYHIDKLCLKLGSALFALNTTKATSTSPHFENQLLYGITVRGSSAEGNPQRVLAGHAKKGIKDND